MTLEATIEAQTNRYHRNLNPVLWNGMELKEEVRSALLGAGNNFIASWGFSIPVKDIVLTGSNASFSWTIFSDCDVHVIVDMAGVDKADKKFVEEFLKVKKQLWNARRKVKVRGYPVEVYAQDTTELLIAQGVFSLMNDKWVRKPTRTMIAKPNMLAVKSKVEDFTNQINDAIVQGNEETLMDIVRRLSEFRKAGLASKGEYSTENIAFKTLRNDGTIKKLRDAIEDTTDRKLTLESTVPRKGFHIKGYDPDKPSPKHYGPHVKLVWYDRHGKHWSGAWHDAEGNQVGDGEHWHTKKEVYSALDDKPPKFEESVELEEKTAAHKKRRSKSSKPTKKYHYVNRHKGPHSKAGGLSSTTRWKKHRTAKLWAWKRSRFSKISRERAASNKNVDRRTYMAARNLTYKTVLGKRKKSKLPFGERGRAERTAKRVYKLNVRAPESRLKYKYRRRDTSRHSGVSFKNP
jgi:predicted nucleotidyltransferase